MSTRINTSLNVEVCHALMDYADENDLTLSKAINEVLSDYFELNEEEVEDEVDADIDDDEEINNNDHHEDGHIE